MRLETLTLLEVGNFTGLDEHNARKYEYSDRTALPTSKRLVVNPFEDALKGETRWSDENIPSETREDNVTLGDSVFTVKTVPTTKRPQYEAVVEGLSGYVDFVMQDYDSNGKRVGVKTIDDKPYMAVDDVLAKIDELTDGALDGKEGVKQSVSITRGAMKGEPGIVIDTRQDYGELTPARAKLYVATSDYVSRVSENIVSPFRKAIKDELGWSADNLPSETKNEFVEVGNLAYPVKTVPKTSTSYSKVVGGLNGPVSAKGNIVKSTGDLTRIQLGKDIEFGGYSVRERDGQKYVSIGGLRERLGELREEFTGSKIEQTIYQVSPLSF